ncbi:MAG: TonB-dependent receptor plug, partial [Candidatus Solibacter sp.]|nr:TonB-dependent receptor plug [Candidatus Solibacter sp.]
GQTSQPDTLNVVSNVNSTHRQVGSVEETHVISPSFLNTVRVGVNREVAGSLQTAPGANPLGADNTLGVVPGLWAPVIQVTGLANFGGGLNGTSYGNYWFTTYQAYDDAFVTHGRHSLKFGFQMQRIQSNYLLAANPDGVYRFNSISDFLQNKPASFQFQYGTLTPRGARQSAYGAYFEDDIRLRKNLTVNLGVRYEPATVPYEVNGKFANLRTLSSPTIYTGGGLFQNPTMRNFEPRVGVAWDPFGTGKTSVRAGFGMFDVLPLTYQFNLAEVSAAPFQQVASTSTLPVGSFPSGAVPLVQQASLLRTTYIQYNPPRNYVMQANVTIQREVVRNVVAMIGYVGSRGIHNAMRSTDANGVIPNATPAGYEWPCAGTIANGLCSKLATSPKFNPAYGQIDAQEWNGHSYYNALVTSLHRKLTNGLDVQGSFTWAKSLDTSSSVGSGGPFSNSISGQFLFNPMRGPSDFNTGKTFVLSGTWEIPLAKTAWYGGWQLGNILTISDGLPFTPVLSGDVLGQGNQSTFDVPNRLNIAGCGSSVNPGNVAQYIKLSCFGFPNPNTLLGNGGRNQLTGPGVVNADVSLFKNIKMRFINESAHLQVRVEAYNMPNRANFAAPLTNNKLFDTKGNPVNFAGQITSLQTPARVMQLGVKLLW